MRAPKGTRARWIAENAGRFVCACGCGSPIRLRAEHFTEGIPAYVHGHNRKGKTSLPVPVSAPCVCGCGQNASPGRRFISGHNGRGVPRPLTVRMKVSAAQLGEGNSMYGRVPHNFKGRLIVMGYVAIHAPTHPFASKKKLVMEHRLTAEAHLREIDPGHEHLCEVDGVLYLRPEIEVHHRNGDKLDNRVENLVTMTTADHARLHLLERQAQERQQASSC